MNKLKIEGMYFHAHHGCLPAEAEIGGKYRVDVTLGSDLAKAAATDKLEFAPDYEEVYLITKEQMMVRSELIETVAKRIADKLSASLRDIDTVKVELTKFDPPISGRHITSATVEWNLP